MHYSTCKEYEKSLRRHLNIYFSGECAVFSKAFDGQFDGLHNMCDGFPIIVNGKKMASIEVFYQACRFPNHPEIQERIISCQESLEAKFESKNNVHLFNTDGPFKGLRRGRADWLEIQRGLMNWCLRLKLIQNFEKFQSLLLSTGELTIVQKSTGSDQFWGTIEFQVKTVSNSPEGHFMNCLIGSNHAGKGLENLRNQLKNDPRFRKIRKLRPPRIENFLFLGNPVREIIRS